MSAHPSMMTRVRATLAHEVSAETLEALRGAGASAYDLLVDAEERRTQLATGGKDAWQFDQATASFFLASWNAFTLQTLGDAFLDADYEIDPGTVGYVPQVTADQILSFYGDVEAWLTRARQAEQHTGFQLDVRVPAVLPAWSEVEPCPMAHLHAMLSACTKLSEHAEIAVNDLHKLGGDQHPDDLGKLNSELTAVKTQAEYASNLHAQLHGSQANQEIHERVEESIKAAIETAFRIGQLAAMPSLIKQAHSPKSPGGTTTSRLPGYGDSGFDRWCLTDPSTRSTWQRDRAAVKAIDALWEYDPQPDATLRIQSEINSAETNGDIERSGHGNYFCCPWAAIYRALNPVTIGGQRIRRGQTFTFDVSAEEMADGGDFKREILIANFSPTTQIDYCNPEEGGHDD